MKPKTARLVARSAARSVARLVAHLRVWRIVVLFLVPLSALYPDSLDGNSAIPQSSTPRIKSALEIQLEGIIDTAYHRYFRSFSIGGRELLLRIPFGQNGERWGRPGYIQRIFLGGKGEPEQIWSEIQRSVDSSAFADYIEKLRRPGDKVVIFCLEDRQVSVFDDPRLIDIMREGPYPGSRTRIYVLKTGSSITESDVYNYLYCIGSVGLDCSGFIYNIEKAIAEAFAVDLDRELAAVFRMLPENLKQIVGLWLFDPASPHSDQVEDRIENLRPGDVILFRGRVPGRGLWFRHSAVIQSIDFENGSIRYLQCTDWAPAEQRGVHESCICFDPAKPETSLLDPTLEWLQPIQPTFEGETPLRFWRNDGHRYRSYQEAGGSVVVRLEIIRRLIESLQSGFYS